MASPFKCYEFRYATVPIGRTDAGSLNVGRIVARVRYEHAFHLLGRKQGPVLHSLTLLPKERIHIYEHDADRRSTSAMSGFSVNTSVRFDVASVSERFGHIAETSSQALETERSLVVSGFGEHERIHSNSLILRNEDDSRAVTYFLRRAFEIYQLSTRIVSIEAQMDGAWVDIAAAPASVQEEVSRLLQRVEVGARHQPNVEIALPADALLCEAVTAIETN